MQFKFHISREFTNSEMQIMNTLKYFFNYIKRKSLRLNNIKYQPCIL